jgi:hypothetical protein
VLDEHIDFVKTAFVQKQLEPFPCSEFPLAVLIFDALLSASEPCAFLELSQSI